ncbi:hypothetical protein GCWU000342_01081 [Shuttleworthella satelles DSM 14600]|uniref:Uncharacterized protein n=1 Tax=Shuttleworthella satelles DSM 14600 TaxID=626523 RepID=C4GAY0_9FIRM|nr:hypothetical protein GCWU000342_01081 [Shuttleworthia satelles DSM 14600]
MLRLNQKKRDRPGGKSAGLFLTVCFFALYAFKRMPTEIERFCKGGFKSRGRQVDPKPLSCAESFDIVDLIRILRRCLIFDNECPGSLQTSYAGEIFAGDDAQQI